MIELSVNSKLERARVQLTLRNDMIRRSMTFFLSKMTRRDLDRDSAGFFRPLPLPVQSLTTGSARITIRDFSTTQTQYFLPSPECDGKLIAKFRMLPPDQTLRTPLLNSPDRDR